VSSPSPMQAHGCRRSRLQCMVTRTRALHARVTIFFPQWFLFALDQARSSFVNRRATSGLPTRAT
jgi:hypothetical protein